MKYIAAVAFVLLSATIPAISQEGNFMKDKHRPQIHFSPEKFWMNDPNGMVYYNGTYHLFFQHYPEKTVWGPMHWGHATSKDLVRWKEEPIALYPDSLGWIFSGSAVIDFKNTSGFGQNGKPAMVAIFTHHNDSLEKLKQNNHQYQSLAYSLDEGKTWTKYANNPVLKSPGIPDFRDPKVSWYEPGKTWIMTLATKDRITFYSSPDLKQWTKLSEFGEKFGAHGGVWECPDLFELPYEGGKKWVLLVSINPGGPNGGSVTQYFTGDFDGKTFVPTDTLTRWMDAGPDNYAGVTFANTGNRRILIGWMSNWDYANEVPTVQWRSAMTIPRELSLTKIDGKPILRSIPVSAVKKLHQKTVVVPKAVLSDSYDLSGKLGTASKGIYELSFETAADKGITLRLSNNVSQYVDLTYDHGKNGFVIDRSQSGEQTFNKAFFRSSFSTRVSTSPTLKMRVIIDHASIEMFADDGTTVMTAVFFPDQVFDKLTLKGKGTVTKISLTSLK